MNTVDRISYLTRIEELEDRIKVMRRQIATLSLMLNAAGVSYDIIRPALKEAEDA